MLRNVVFYPLHWALTTCDRVLSAYLDWAKARGL